jgi:hypothetical protein
LQSLILTVHCRSAGSIINIASGAARLASGRALLASKGGILSLTLEPSKCGNRDVDIVVGGTKR